MEAWGIGLLWQGGCYTGAIYIKKILANESHFYNFSTWIIAFEDKTKELYLTVG